jgi:regulator of protease activity HflC (stomatin/prohibitin superfamily)
MKRSLLYLLACVCALAPMGCGTTSSTEVGVRTNLFGVFESRGQQQIYQPGGVYFFLPVINSWYTLPISQQNLVMTADPNEGDRPIPDDITFKTKDGNNVYIDVNVMWRIDPQKAGQIVSMVGQDIMELKERVVRPIARSTIRDVFNEITSEEYYQVTVKNRMALKAQAQLQKEIAPFGIIIDMLQVQQHRFDKEYQDAINAQKKAEADVQTLIEQQKNMEVQKKSELEAKRSEWNRRMEEAMGQAGKIKNDADGYYQTKTNQAKAMIAVAQAEADGIRKQAEALGKMGGDAYVKMQVAKQFANKKILIVPGSNVSTMNVNELVDFLLGKAQQRAKPPAGGDSQD